jgi:hypothetical protein
LIGYVVVITRKPSVYQRSGYDRPPKIMTKNPGCAPAAGLNSRLPGPDDSQYLMAPSRSWLAAAVLMMMSRISSREPNSLSRERSADPRKRSRCASRS